MRRGFIWCLRSTGGLRVGLHPSLHTGESLASRSARPRPQGLAIGQILRPR
jgi:hypothetical protein